MVNQGNTASDVELTGRDDAGGLRFRVAPERLRVQGGDTGRTRVEVTARRRRWFARSQAVAFRVEARGAGTPEPVWASGRFEQRPYLPRWAPLLPVLALALAAWVMTTRPLRVPAVKGLTPRAAELEILRGGLRPARHEVAPANPRRPRPGVIEQSPAPDTKAKPGESVSFVVEAGAGTPRSRHSLVLRSPPRATGSSLRAS